MCPVNDEESFRITIYGKGRGPYLLPKNRSLYLFVPYVSPSERLRPRSLLSSTPGLERAVPPEAGRYDPGAVIAVTPGECSRACSLRNFPRRCGVTFSDSVTYPSGLPTDQAASSCIACRQRHKARGVISRIPRSSRRHTSKTHLPIMKRCLAPAAFTPSSAALDILFCSQWQQPPLSPPRYPGQQELRSPSRRNKPLPSISADR